MAMKKSFACFPSTSSGSVSSSNSMPPAPSSPRDPFDDILTSDSISDTTISERDQTEHHHLPHQHNQIDLLLPSSSSSSASTTTGFFRCLLSFRPGNAAGISALAISDHSLYSGSEDGLVCCYRLADLSLTDRLSAAASGSVKALLVRRGGREIYSAHQDHKIRAWSRPSPSRSSVSSSTHRLVATLPTIRDVVATSIRGSRGLVRTRRHRKSPWNQHFDTISALAVDEDAAILYSASWDRSLKAWRLRDLRCLESIGDAHTDAINGLAVGRGGVVFSGSADSTIKVWKRGRLDPGSRRMNWKALDRRSGYGMRLVAELAQTSPVNCVAACGSWVYAGCSDGKVSVWMVAVEEEEEEDAPPSPPQSAEEEPAEASSSDGGEEDGQRCFRVDHGQRSQVRVYREEFPALCGHTQAVLAVCAVGEVLCSGSADRSIRVWRREGERHACVCVVSDLQQSRCPIKSLAVSVEGAGDGCIVYSGGLDGFLKAWWVSLRGGSKQRRIAGDSPCSVLDHVR